MADVLSKEDIDAEVERVMRIVTHPLDRYMGLYRLAEQRGADDPLVKAFSAAFVMDIMSGPKHG